VQTRDTAKALARALDERSRIDADVFLGQSGDDGLTQSEQLDKLGTFRDGETNVLVSTSVGEEGLDIPSVDLVVFYEPVASAIRTIQRRGRTGRESSGRVTVLMARGTSDEAAYWAANKKEKKMRQLITELQDSKPPEPDPVIRPNPSARPSEEDQTPRLAVDHRELNGALARLLMQDGLKLEPTDLEVADLVLSNRVAVERKTARDFVESLTDGRLMGQASQLADNYEAPTLLVVGDPFKQAGGVDEACVAGAIAALSASFDLPVVTVDDARQAANVVGQMAKREHEDDQGPPKLRHETGGQSLVDKQRFLLEGLPNVSAKLSQRLLDAFGSPGAVFESDEEQLREVRGIGPQTASKIHEVLHERTETPWESETSNTTTARARTTPSGTGPERPASSKSSRTTP
jgi:Fanconi anemia group M protein